MREGRDLKYFRVDGSKILGSLLGPTKGWSFFRFVVPKPTQVIDVGPAAQDVNRPQTMEFLKNLVDKGSTSEKVNPRIDEHGVASSIPLGKWAFHDLEKM